MPSSLLLAQQGLLLPSDLRYRYRDSKTCMHVNLWIGVQAASMDEADT